MPAHTFISAQPEENDDFRVSVTCRYFSSSVVQRVVTRHCLVEVKTFRALVEVESNTLINEITHLLTLQQC